nr:protein shisa-like-1 [Chrysemys picta bellii]
MLHRLLLGGLLCTTLPTSFLGTASARNLQLCEGYPSPDGRYHSGFYCPRLTDPPAHRYCCRHGDHALKSCCPQMEFESLRRVNLSNVPTPARLRNPLPLLAVGLYGLLILTLMSLDFLHFCRLNQRRFYSLLSSSRLGKRLASSFPRPGPARGGTQQQELPTAQPGAAHGLARSCPRPGPARGGTQRQELPTAQPGAAHGPARSCPRPGPAQGGTQQQELPMAQPGAAHGLARSCPRPGPARGGTQRQELPTAQTSQDSKCEEPGPQ